MWSRAALFFAMLMMVGVSLIWSPSTAEAQSRDTWVRYSGGHCTVCNDGRSRNYACSNGHGSWSSGQRTFRDPLGSRYYITRVEYLAYGVWGCSGRTSTIEGRLNSWHFRTLSGSGQCRCGSCDRTLNYVSGYYSNGIPGYRYNTNNTVYMRQTRGLSCISRVRVRLHYRGRSVTCYRDYDGDGYGDPRVTSQRTTCNSGWVSNRNDCYDRDRNIRPGAPERCNGRDDNCNGQVDEGIYRYYYYDRDRDTYGTNSRLYRCSPYSYYTATRNGDCNDGNPNIRPGAREICNNIDDDCDGTKDEGAGGRYWYLDRDRDRYGTSRIFQCRASGSYTATVGGDCDDGRNYVNPGRSEVCGNGLDDNCNGQTDENMRTYYEDRDRDGWGNRNRPRRACSQPSGYTTRTHDCDDTTNRRYPGLREVCDNIDNDCDGSVDEGLRVYMYRDADRDGYGVSGSRYTHRSSQQYLYSSRNPVSWRYGYPTASGNVTMDVYGCGDINSSSEYFQFNLDGSYVSYIFRYGTGTCWIRHRVTISEAFWNARVPGAMLFQFYRSGAMGGAHTYFIVSYNRGPTHLVCAGTPGYANRAGDCHDGRSNMHPGHPEVCGDGLDNNCNGQTDENLQTFYRDRDGDGYGTTSGRFCSRPNGWATRGGDCDDNNNRRYPGNREVCDGIDNNCVNGVDENLRVYMYRDADRDGYGRNGSTYTHRSSQQYLYSSRNPVSWRYGYPTASSNVTMDVYGCGDINSSSEYFQFNLDGSYVSYIFRYGTGTCWIRHRVTISAAFWNARVPGAMLFQFYRSGAMGGAHTYFIVNYSRGPDQLVCPGTPGYSTRGGDCDDGRSNVNPGHAEVCGDRLDNNCNGQVDENIITWYQDRDGDGFGNNGARTTACTQPRGYVRNNRDCRDDLANVNPNAREICDNIDNDCDGSTDEGFAHRRYYYDRDGDTYGTNSYITECKAYGNYRALRNGDCRDDTNRAHPAHPEVCGDGIDNNCNGQTDENIITWYRDADNDGYGGASTRACTQPRGYIRRGGDCDDSRSDVNPGRTEVCNGRDDNCVGGIDENLRVYMYRDADRDGYGVAGSRYTHRSSQQYLYSSRNPVSWRYGYPVASGNVTMDVYGCGDINSSSEYFQFNLDGSYVSYIFRYGTGTCWIRHRVTISEAFWNARVPGAMLFQFYRSGAMGGAHTYFIVSYNRGAEHLVCPGTPGYATNNRDCDDRRANVNPGHAEVCGDRLDNNCNGQIDENIITWYQDRDGDRYGNNGARTTACTQPRGYVRNNTDCDDGNARRFPGNTEVCDNIDNNCNNQVDEGLLVNLYRDVDRDGYGAENVGTYTFRSSQQYLYSSRNPVSWTYTNMPQSQGNVTMDVYGCGDINSSSEYFQFNLDGSYVSYIFRYGTGTCWIRHRVTIGASFWNARAQDNRLLFQFYRSGAMGGAHTYFILNYSRRNTFPVCPGTPGYTSRGGDCDDRRSNVNPGQAEICGDGLDNNCNGTVDENLITYYRDADGDGYGTTSTTRACSLPRGYAVRGGDCDDGRSDVNPGRTEVCNGRDDNCDGRTDENLLVSLYRDNDRDGYAQERRSYSLRSSQQYLYSRRNPVRWTYTNMPNTSGNVTMDVYGCGDINSSSEYFQFNLDGSFVSYIYRYSTGTCWIRHRVTISAAFWNARNTDNRLQFDFYRSSSMASAHTYFIVNYSTGSDRVSVCPGTPGFTNRLGDCNDSNPRINPGVSEICGNRVDDNCNGQVDENINTYYLDRDGDTYGTNQTTQACTRPRGYADRGGDCDDTRSDVNPGRTEVCNGRDDNCDGNTDEGLLVTLYRDADGDGVGAAPAQVCPGTSGYVTRRGDCNDGDAAIFPGATEICDNKDNNCNGTTDEGLRVTKFVDNDRDGFGSTSTQSVCPQWPGFSTNNRDCDDTRASVNPDATEVCGNGLDDNCNGAVDENILTWYRDADNDTWGLRGSTTRACTRPNGYVARHGDCDDTRNNVFPGANEVCDHLDNDCDGDTDEGVTVALRRDADGDGYGSFERQRCQGDSGWVVRGGDCDDSRSTVNPGAPEICGNNIDDNCDGDIDENKLTFYVDRDGDGHGDRGTTTLACTLPNGYSANGNDCNDTNNAIHPGAREICDNIDNNCANGIDEGLRVTRYRDADNDTYGTSTTAQVCPQWTGYSSRQGDCNDGDRLINPGALEVCDFVDNNCNGTIDEGGENGAVYTIRATSQVNLSYRRSWRSTRQDLLYAYSNYYDITGWLGFNLSAIPDGAIIESMTLSLHQHNSYYYNGPQVRFYASNANNWNTSATTSTLRRDRVISQNFTSFRRNARNSFALNHDAFDWNVELQDNWISVGIDELRDNSRRYIYWHGRSYNGREPQLIIRTRGTGGTLRVERFRDRDGDSYGDASALVCTDTPGYVTRDGDCNDNVSAINPGADEICGNNIDDNCDGQVDENIITWYRDVDGDTYGNSQTVRACTQPNGFVNRGGDCNDGEASINPGATEVCDHIDNNCDGDTDEGLLVARFRDADGDGFGTAQRGNVCPGDDGWSTRNDDCDDTRDFIHPGAEEICGNNLDDDCDGDVDENRITFYLDRDGDSYGGTNTTLACTVPNGYVGRGGDCVDTNPAINPGAEEICNEVDDNCDGNIDEGIDTRDYYLDVDGDTYGTGGEIKVAVVRSRSNYAAADQVVAQLNDDTYQDFTATAVRVSQIDTATELGQYDLVILGDSGYNEDEFNVTFANALNTWVRAGGGLISTGWVDYSLGNDSTGIAMDRVIPTDVTPHGYAYCYSGHRLTITGGNHEITAGLPTSFAVAGNYIEFSPLALDIPGARTLGIASGGRCTAGGTRSGLVAADYGSGRTVYLGMLYMARQSNYNTGGLRSGVYDRLFEQTAKWAAKGGGSKITACRPRGNYRATRNGDCNDGNVNINPGAEEVCDFVDNNCTNGIDEGLRVTRFRDVDGDNYGTSQTANVCPDTTGYANQQGDCNDNNVNINPGVDEICGNNIDDNCNGQTDENILTWYRDVDGDTFGNQNSPTQACTQPNGYVARGLDCVDTNANINPDAEEICNEIDDNCDGSIDEGLETREYFLDEDRDTYGANSGGTVNVAVVRSGSNYAAAPQVAAQLNDDTYHDFNATVVSVSQIDSATELANYDVVVLGDSGYNEDQFSVTFANALDAYVRGGGGLISTGWVDYSLRSDSIGVAMDRVIPTDVSPHGYSYCYSGHRLTITGGNHEITEGLPSSFAVAGNYIEFSPIAPDIPGAQVLGLASGGVCTANGTRSGLVAADLGEGRTVYLGMLYMARQTNYNTSGLRSGIYDRLFEQTVKWAGRGGVPSINVCGPRGNYTATRDGDCNDDNRVVNPGVDEICGNDIDDNCDGTVDEGTETYYRDGDGDNYGNVNSSIRACDAPNGYVADRTDCDDTRNNVNPGANEVCDDLDNNCDGTVDEGLRERRFRDADGDTYGTSTTALVCPQWTGWADRDGDCNDNNRLINPGAEEICGDGIDNNCDGQADENIRTWYLDADGDTYGSARLTRACDQPNNYVARTGDCNDANANVNPGATEVCNGIDDNCDTRTDEDLLISLYRDGDGDGFGSDRQSDVCPGSNGYSNRTGDCDDSRDFIYPGATELCGNNLDDNCNGQIDENKTRFYRDFDGDTFGNPNNSSLFCARPSGYVTDQTDCNDGVATINPDATERCNNVDDNCNGTTDEGNPDAGDACNTGLPGVCAEESTTICLGGNVVCGPNDTNGYGTIDQITVPGGLLGRSTGVVNTDWKLLTSNGVYLFNLAYGRNGGTYNGYTVRVIDPANNFAEVKSFQVGNSSDYIDGISARGDIVYAIQWTGGNGARVTEINWRTEAIARTTTLDQGTSQAIEGQYDWINDVHWMGALRNNARIYEHRGNELSTASRVRQFDIATGQSGAGAVASDGRFLYVKRWISYPGTDELVRVGTGYNNTVRGVIYGTIPNIPAAISTSYHSDGYIYVGSNGSNDRVTRVKVTDARREICDDGIDNNCNGGIDDYCPSPDPYDDFDNGLVRCSWNVSSSHGNATQPEVSNGVLKAKIASSVSGQPNYNSGLNSRFTLTGDFDIEVDFRLVRWHPESGIRVNLAAAAGTAHRLNERGGNEHYVANFGGNIGRFVSTNQTEGKLRLLRQGNELIAMYNDAGWREFHRVGGQSTGATTVNLSIHGHGSLPSDIEVHFDNFIVRGGNIGEPPAFGPETCDGLDNNCDGTVDENTSVACSSQCGNGVRACVDGVLAECTARQPADNEFCDDGIDNDCNGETDEHCGGFNPFDDFNDGNIAACRWRTTFSPAFNQGNNTGVRVDESGGVFRVRYGGNTRVANFNGAITSRFGVEGDFDMQVDYAVPQWPTRNHVRVALVASGGGQSASLERTSDRSEGESVVSNIAGNVSGRRATGAREGRLRIVRTGNVVRTLYMDGLNGQWVQNAAGAFNTSIINLSLSSWGHDFLPGDVTVNYDNLTFNGCNETPCRTWAGGRLVSFGGVGTPEGPFDQSTCDGLDNDCDGLTDGFDRRCETLCGVGSETCTLGNWGTCTAREPIEEVCDGADNDCDGDIDEDDPNENTFCVVNGQQGVCSQGRRICRGDQGLVCEGPSASTEVCDGLDNDCDGTTDEPGTSPDIFRSDDLVGYWSFEEASGSTFRDNAGANDEGTIARDARLGRTGRYGKGLELDGSQDHGEIAAEGGELDMDTHNQITIAAWLHPRQHTARAFTIYRTNSYYLTLLNGRPAFYGYGLANPGYHTAPQPLALDTWTHVAATYNGSSVKLYVNGSEVYTANTTGAFTADATPLIFGHKTNGDDTAFNGFMDEVLISRAALSSAEINTILEPEMPGASVRCDTGNLGACQAGASVCTDGVFACDGADPRPELCDSIDNNCDGTVDEGNPQGGGTCRTQNPGICATGTFMCTGGSLACDAIQPGTRTEVCDGADNDCDGQTDESFPTQGDTCSTGRQGVCATGQKRCVQGNEACVGPNPSAEVCDNEDNDCDGATDETLTRACSTICGGGTETCSAGNWGGCTARQPTTEICDNEDNDCDGRTDESIRRSCRSTCGGGTQLCAEGNFGDCSAPLPGTETCDGLDNDCNGFIDDSVDCGCQYFPRDEPVQPTLEWSWTGSDTEPDSNQVSMTPISGPLTDTNNDGRINEDDVPTILFTTVAAGNGAELLGGYLRAVDGSNGNELWTYTDRKVYGGSSPALGDLDDDGVTEIVAYAWRDRSRGAPQDAGLVAIDGAGNEIWNNTDVNRGGHRELGSPAIANIDPDTAGNEIASCFWLVSAAGETLWDVWDDLPNGYTPRGFCSPAVADIDGDNQMEIVIGARAYNHDGTVAWTNTGLYGQWSLDYDIAPAIADLNDDGTPEVIVVRGAVYVLNGQTGAIMAQHSIGGGGQGGSPNVADFDGDGLPEIGVAGAQAYGVYKLTTINNVPTLSIVWQRQTRDISSGTSGSSVFDFNGDGVADVVYNDEQFLRVFNGRTGEVVFEEANASETQVEYPVIIDADNDGNAEIVVGRSDGTANSGLRAYGDANDNWVNTRTIWNQYSYHVTNVNDNGSIPVTETRGWTRRNTNNYRNNFQGDQGLFSAPDLVVSLQGNVVQGADAGNYENGVAYCPAFNRLTVRVCNDGDVPVPAGAQVGIYVGHPSEGVLVATAQTTNRLEDGDQDNCQDISAEWNSQLAGTHELFAQVDFENNHNECDEDNNIRSLGSHTMQIIEEEKCDNVDNNCDTNIDESLVRDCSTQCGDGTQTCSAGDWGDCSTPEPTDEVCDGIDNNCDGTVDNDSCVDGQICNHDSLEDTYTCIDLLTVEGEDCGYGCPLGNVCEDGHCVPHCESDFGCPDGESCEDSICVPTETGSLDQTFDEGREEQIATPMGACSASSFTKGAAPAGGFGFLVLLGLGLVVVRRRREE